MVCTLRVLRFAKEWKDDLFWISCIDAVERRYLCNLTGRLQIQNIRFRTSKFSWTKHVGVTGQLKIYFESNGASSSDLELLAKSSRNHWLPPQKIYNMILVGMLVFFKHNCAGGEGTSTFSDLPLGAFGIVTRSLCFKWASFTFSQSLNYFPQGDPGLKGQKGQPGQDGAAVRNLFTWYSWCWWYIYSINKLFSTKVQ